MNLILRIVRPELALLLVVAFALARIVDTYDIFNHTWDEPAHMAAGLELLDLGTYTLERQHPPLARAAVAIGPYLDGQRSQRPVAPANYDFWDRQLQMFDEGRRMLYDAGPYDRVLALARAGNLPFVVIALIGTFCWARRISGPWPAAAAALLLATVPPFIGNAGLATLDVAVASLGVVSLFLFCRWLDQPGAGRALAFGVATGLTIMTKFSAIPFLGVVFVFITGWRAWMEARSGGRRILISARHLRTAVVSVVAMTAVFWLSYGFEYTSVANPANRPFESVARVFGAGTELNRLVSDLLVLNVVPVFVPDMIRGMAEVWWHNASGHLSYLLGEVRTQGWWNFYLIALGVRTPIPLLILGAVGIGALLTESYRNRDWRAGAPAIAFVAILLFVSVYSRINLGIRHVLILYPLLAILGAHAILRLASVKSGRALALAALSALGIWQIAAAVTAHPDNMTYFNVIAGGHPERILIAADLDWGQDLRRLKHEVQRRRIDRISVAYYGSARPARHGFPEYQDLEPRTPVTGWVAISLWKRELTDDYSWLREFEPVARVGRSIDLYHIDESSHRRSGRVPGQSVADAIDRR